MDERDKIKNFASKDKLDQYLASGKGMADFKKEEKSLFLGEFRERVLKALTIAQLQEEGTYDEVEQAIRDPRAFKLLINRKADLKKAAEYIRIAKAASIQFTTVDSDSIQGTLGLVVASKEAVDVEDIYVEDRKKRLKRLGLPESIIDNPGKKLCKKCYEKVRELAPEEMKNYKTLTLSDRLLGVKCEVC